MQYITPTINGTSLSDSLYGTDNNDSIAGYAGNDVIHGNEGNDYIFGNGALTSGFDTIYGGSGHDTINGGDSTLSSKGVFYGEAGNDLLLGSDGHDTLVGGTEADTMTGYLGDDVFRFTSLSDSTNTAKDKITDFYKGALEHDRLDFSSLDLNNMTVRANLVPGSNNSWNITIDNTDFALEVKGFNTVLHLTADDFTFGGGQQVNLIIGNNPVSPPAPSPVSALTGLGSGTIQAGTYTFSSGGNIDISGQNIIAGQINLNGSDNANNIIASAGQDNISAFGGDDNIQAGNGNDTVTAGDGSDTAYGNQGLDTLYGNTGNDTLYGGQDSDTVYGGQGADFVYGNLGNDFVYGNMAEDYLHGGAGEDYLHGGAGNDALIGGIGNDTLNGGIGDDLFMIASNQGIDSIESFEGVGAAGGDRIQFTDEVAATLGVTSSAELVGRFDYSSGNAVLDLGGGHSLTLIGITAGLSADDVVIGG